MQRHAEAPASIELPAATAASSADQEQGGVELPQNDSGALWLNAAPGQKSNLLELLGGTD